MLLLSFHSADLPAGILNEDGTLNNDASCLRLAEVAVAYARAGETAFCMRIEVGANMQSLSLRCDKA